MLIQQLTAYPNYLLVKFQKVVETDSIVDSSFVLSLDDEVVDAFQTIDVARDYNSISRTLYLYWTNDVLELTDYTLSVTGLTGLFSNTFDDEEYSFTTPERLSVVELTPLIPTFYIEDYSIADVDFSASTETESATPNLDPLLIVSTTPGREIFVASEEIDDDLFFRIQIEFSHVINTTDIADYVTIQNKELTFFYTGWNDVEIEGSFDFDEDTNILEFLIPAEETNYKYRIILSISISELDDDSNHLAEQYELEFTTALNPFYSNPEELLDYYDITEVEAGELILKYSLEAKKILNLSDTDDPTFLAVEYVTAAALCALSKKYDNILGTGTNADDVTLGDFRVSRKTGASSGPNKRATRDSAQTWCELAAALRRELKVNSRLPRNYVRSGRHKNPIPRRYFKDIHTMKPLINPIDSGLINDEF